MAAAQYFNQIQKIYIAFYQRPADPAGLRYWADRVDVAGGDIGQVINAFASSAEATALYGPINSTTIGSVLDSLYLALFNVMPDAAGRQFYVDAFTAGTFTAGTIALAVLNGARNDDLIAINNKMQVANEFTQQVDGRPLTDAFFGTGSNFDVTYDGADVVAARNILKTVTAQPVTVIDPAGVTAVLKTDIANPGDPILAQTSGQNYTLTVGQDNIPGTSGNDTINGDHLTLQASDIINGGTGTLDTLNYTDGSALGVAPAVAVVSGVEIINIRNVNVANAAHFVAATNYAGATHFNSNTSTADVNFIGLAAGQQAGMVGNGTVLNGNLGVSYANAVTAGVIHVSGGTTQGTIIETGTGITSNTIHSTGAANELTNVVLSGTANTALTINAATNLDTGNITGFTGTNSQVTIAGAAMSVDIGTLENGTVKTVDASGLMAGGVTTTLSTNTAIVFIGGAGDDEVTAGTVLTTGASVDAGAGSADLLVIANSAHLTAATAPFYKGFDVLQANTGVTADVTQLVANNTITGIRINDSVNGGSVTVNGLSAAQAANVAIIAASNAVGPITLGLTGASIGGQTDTVKATLTTTTAAGAAQVSNLTGLSLVGVEKLELAGTGTAALTTGVITLTTTSATSLDSIKLATVGAATVVVDAAHAALNLNVNGSASSGNLLLDGTAYLITTGLTLLGGSGDDVVLGGSAASTRDNLVGGSGNDSLAGEGGTVASGGALFTAINANTAADILTGGAGKDVFGISAVVNLANLDTIMDMDFGTLNASGQVDRIVINGTTAAATAAAIVVLSVAEQNAVTAAGTFAVAVGLAAGNATLAATANTVATFTYGADTYLITNDVVGGAFNAAQDTVVKITGSVGTLDISDIVFV